MYKHKFTRALVLMTLFLFINLTFSGCYYTREASLDNSKSFKIEKIELIDGSTKKFIYDKVEYAYFINNEIIVYRPKDNTETKIPMELVKKIYVRKFNGPATMVFIFTGAVVLYYTIALFAFMFRSHREIPSNY